MSLIIPFCNKCGRDCITGLCGHCGNGYDVLAKIAKERETKKRKKKLTPVQKKGITAEMTRR